MICFLFDCLTIMEEYHQWTNETLTAFTVGMCLALLMTYCIDRERRVAVGEREKREKKKKFKKKKKRKEERKHNSYGGREEADLTVLKLSQISTSCLQQESDYYISIFNSRSIHL